MTLSLTQTYTAVAPGLTASFLAFGGTAPYAYTVLAGGAGGTIDPVTGVYTAPATASSSPNQAYDTVQVDDDVDATATARILVGSPLMLFCDVIQNGMGLADGRVYLWDQKLFQPKDYDLYVAVSVPFCKPFGNCTETTTDDDGNYVQVQSVNMYAVMEMDVISRGPAARDRKEELILALNSVYAEQQQEKNSFGIGRISTNFNNLSMIDGAAIPYRYKISCALQYFTSKVIAAPYFDSFDTPTIVIDN